MIINKFVGQLIETMLEMVEFNLNKFCTLLNINNQFFVLLFGSKTFFTPVNIHSSILSILICLSLLGADGGLPREICWSFSYSSNTNIPCKWSRLVRVLGSVPIKQFEYFQIYS